MDLEGKWKAILIGGLIAGLAPLVPLLKLACCLIPFAAAIVAVAIYSNSAPPPDLNNNDGVVLGVMTGVVGTLIYAMLAIPLVFYFGNAIGGFLGRTLPDFTEIPANVKPLVQGILSHFGGILTFVVIFHVLSQLALSLIFGILGGLVGIAIFRRKPAVQ